MYINIHQIYIKYVIDTWTQILRIKPNNINLFSTYFNTTNICTSYNDLQKSFKTVRYRMTTIVKLWDPHIKRKVYTNMVNPSRITFLAYFLKLCFDSLMMVC